MRNRLILGLAIVLAASTLAMQAQRGRGPQGPPQINGDWTGTWTSFNPAQATSQPQELCKKLDASVVREGDTWLATFEGDCGRPYKYKITMKGRLVGSAVMFTGTVDLGQQDG
jgi:hypothetical protein